MDRIVVNAILDFSSLSWFCAIRDWCRFSIDLDIQSVSLFGIIQNVSNCFYFQNSLIERLIFLESSRMSSIEANVSTALTHWIGSNTSISVLVFNTPFYLLYFMIFQLLACFRMPIWFFLFSFHSFKRDPNSLTDINCVGGLLAAVKIDKKMPFHSLWQIPWSLDSVLVVWKSPKKKLCIDWE